MNFFPPLLPGRRAACRHFGWKIVGALVLTNGLSANVPDQPKVPNVAMTTPMIPAMDAPFKMRMIFGVGVGFARTGAGQGAVISTVLPGSPTARAGLAVGCIVVEINGEPTANRPGDDCARMIRESFGPVRLKILDAEMKEKTLILEKTWLPLPDERQ